jgi:hypothetical protein
MEHEPKHYLQLPDPRVHHDVLTDADDKQGRISKGIHGIPKVSLGPAMPCHYMTCRRQPLKQLFQG